MGLQYFCSWWCGQFVDNHTPRPRWTALWRLRISCCWAFCPSWSLSVMGAVTEEVWVGPLKLGCFSIIASIFITPLSCIFALRLPEETSLSSPRPYMGCRCSTALAAGCSLFQTRYSWGAWFWWGEQLHLAYEEWERSQYYWVEAIIYAEAEVPKVHRLGGLLPTVTPIWDLNDKIHSPAMPYGTISTLVKKHL